MVSGTWGWDLQFMLTHFGWRSAIAVLVNTILLISIFKTELLEIKFKDDTSEKAVPFPIIIMHLLFLVGVVLFAHHPAVFMSLFLFFFI